jgi:integrase
MGFRTQAQVDKLEPPLDSDGKPKLDAYVWDDEQPGLSIRLKGKARTWTVWYQVNGARRKVALGAVGSAKGGMTLKKARDEASRIVSGARADKDPLRDRAAAKAKAADTLGALVKLYLERRAKPRQRTRTYVEVERYLSRYWAPLHARAVESLTRRDVASRLEELRVDHGGIAANRARTYLSACLSWGMKQGLAEHNPVVGTEAPAEERRRDRVLSPAELVAVWKACEGHGEFGEIVRLLMLTGARREEVAGLRWSELDLDRALWTLPAARAKNEREHEVPLPRQAVALLAARDRVGEFVFGRHGRSPFSGYSRAKERLNQALGDAVASWTLHDLRRSAVTHMVELGIAPHIVEATINHISGHKGGVAGIYNRANYREQKQAALQAWADHLEALVEGREPASNVVQMRG